MSGAAKSTDREVERRLAAIEHARGSVAHLAPGRSLADELVADRRAEVGAEQIAAVADQDGDAA